MIPLDGEHLCRQPGLEEASGTVVGREGFSRSGQSKEERNCMRTFAVIFATACLFGLAACDSSNNSSPEASDQASSTPETQNAPVDQDPTPQTGTGGESQSTNPDGTVRGAPAQ
jgi:hypothetical protein